MGYTTPDSHIIGDHTFLDGGATPKFDGPMVRVSEKHQQAQDFVQTLKNHAGRATNFNLHPSQPARPLLIHLALILAISLAVYLCFRVLNRTLRMVVRKMAPQSPITSAVPSPLKLDEKINLSPNSQASSSGSPPLHTPTTPFEISELETGNWSSPSAPVSTSISTNAHNSREIDYHSDLPGRTASPAFAGHCSERDVPLDGFRVTTRC